MLFYLTKSLMVDKGDPEYPRVFEAVKYIASAAYQGKHLVLADYDALVHFRSWFEYDPALGALFSRLIEDYSISSIPSFLGYYIEVVKKLTPVKRDRRVGQMEYTVFLDSDCASQCSLIGENDYDCKFYRHILQWYLNEHYPNITIRVLYTDVNGSGGDTPSAIKKEIEKRHVSVCIVDVDVKYPGDMPKKDSTCIKCRAVNQIQPFYEYLELDVHEIENLIPYNYLCHIDRWDGGAKTKKEAFDRICDKPEIMRYFDIKEGVSRSERAAGGYYDFGRLCYNSNPDFVLEQTYEEKYSSGDKTIYPGLSDKALKKTLLWLDRRTVNEPPVLLDFQRENWEKIGALLLDFGIARNREVVY